MTSGDRLRASTHANGVAGPADASPMNASEPMDASPMDAGVPPAAEPILTEWLFAHGAKGSLEGFGNECCCVELRVGTAREPAMQCDELEDVGDADGYWVVVHRVIRIVRGGKIVKVLDVPTHVGNLDRPPAPLGVSRRPWADFGLELRIARDGSSATLDDADHDGAARIENHKPKDALDEAIRHICAARGVYRWNGGRFRR